VSPRARWIALFVCAGCAAAGRSDRPPPPGPPPAPGAHTPQGFPSAVRAGSDYVVANTGVTNPTVTKSQTLPSGMVELTFDLGPGVPEPMQVVVDPNQGKVQNLEPVQQVPVVTDKAR